MAVFTVLLVLSLLGPLTMAEGEVDATCDDFIKSLSKHDIHLSLRVELAGNLTMAGATAQEFVDQLTHLKEGGKKYACGNTRFWIDGIFNGFARQFEERRRFDQYEGVGYGLEAGYYDAIGNDQVIKLFKSYSNLKDSLVLYKFQTSGVLDHVWAVLQKPGPEYKIFQSYNMAYSVHAWLSDNVDGLYSKNPPGYIRYWDEVLYAFAQYLKEHGGEIMTNGTIIFPPGLPEIYQEWAYYIVNYNESQIMGNFKKSWSKFGKNAWLENEFFTREYVIPLQQMMDTIKTMVGTTEKWTPELHESWITLFASPDPVNYPGIEFNALTGTFPKQKLELQVRVDVLPMENMDCYSNYVKTGSQIPGWKNEYEPKSSGFKLESSLLPISLVTIMHMLKNFF